MAGRIRTVKPELLTHPRFGTLSDAAARTYYGLLGLVDDCGRCPAAPSILAGQIFWGRQRSAGAIGRILAELEAAGWLRRYPAEGGIYLELLGWSDKRSPSYQYIDKPQGQRYPAPNPIHAPNGAPTPEPTSAPTDLRSPISDQDRERDLSRARAIQPAAPPASPTPPRPEPAADRGRQAPDPRVKINHDAWAYAAAKHAELRAEGIDPHAIAFPPMPVGAGGGDLVARTRELTADRADYASAMAVHRRRIDVMAAECRRDDVRHLRWFTPSRIWEEKPFWKAAELQPEQAGVTRAGPRSAEPPMLRIVEDDDEIPSWWGRTGKGGPA